MSSYICNDKKCPNGTVCPDYAPTGKDKMCLRCKTYNCASCLSDGLSQCITCNQGYFLQNWTCKLCQAGCRTCDNDYECTSCLSGYQLKGRYCYKCSDNCIDCDKYGDCNICRPGFFTGVDPDCYKCDTGCTKCVSSSNCSVCSGGFELIKQHVKLVPQVARPAVMEVARNATTLMLQKTDNALSALVTAANAQPKAPVPLVKTETS